ncbi:MAG: hypothetical protein ACXABY_20880 [Candidatus Thorarchaeota archaeon]|jgi:hypothetical protein
MGGIRGDGLSMEFVKIKDKNGDVLDGQKGLIVDTGSELTWVLHDNIKDTIGGDPGVWDNGPIVRETFMGEGVVGMQMGGCTMEVRTFDHMDANEITMTCPNMYHTPRLPESIRPEHGILGRDQLDHLKVNSVRDAANVRVWLMRRVNPE